MTSSYRMELDHEGKANNDTEPCLGNRKRLKLHKVSLNLRYNLPKLIRRRTPAPYPIGHYWEKESAGVWGVGFGVSRKAGYYFSYLLGEIIFANLFLFFQLIFNQFIVLGLIRATARISGRIDVGAMMKRTIDNTGAMIGLLLTSPFWLLIALAIKLDSKGPIFYIQKRIGRNRRQSERRAVMLAGQERRSLADRRTQPGHGKMFSIIKFRSMCQNAESKIGPVWAQKNDPRITSVGHFLRVTRLDEIPQLINVLMGDMSLVGPRPERPFFVDDLEAKIKNYTSRFDVKPGITGLAQVEHKYDESLDDVIKKTTYDLRYIRNWTVLQDLRIILRTVRVVVSGRGM